jgi:hypothetical protein
MSQIGRLPENSCRLKHLAEIIASWWLHSRPTGGATAVAIGVGGGSVDPERCPATMQEDSAHVALVEHSKPDAEES